MSELSGRAATGREDEAQEQLVRVFVDADGVRWSVKETPFSEYDRRRGVSLIFWSEGAVRRVRDYPADWHLLPDEHLALLSWKV